MSGPVHADTRNMNTIHIMFRRESGLMPEPVASVPDAERAKVVTDHIRFINHLLHHHQAEDAVLWPQASDVVVGTPSVSAGAR